jgi:hypothetical protein
MKKVVLLFSIIAISLLTMSMVNKETITVNSEMIDCSRKNCSYCNAKGQYNEHLGQCIVWHARDCSKPDQK